MLTLYKIEIVKDKPTKTPFPFADKVAPRIHAIGLQREHGISLLPGGGVADGVNGDLIVLAPPYTINKQEAEWIVERAARAIESVLGPTKPAKL